MDQISVKNVSRFYGSEAAVQDISFGISTGEHLVLLGTSGCGKTTTLKMINRLIPCSAGTILVNGKDISGQSPEILRRGIGYVLQHHSLFPHYTVADNIAVVPRMLKWSRPEITARTATLIHKLHLQEDYLQKYPQQLSGGEAQRVNLARALAADPPILLMDEPFGALDPVTRLAIRKEFRELEEFRQKTILMVTHDIQEAFELGDRICLMDKGRIMQIGKPAELLFRPANDFVKNFLAGAYLQLAFMITRIKDIWTYLPGLDHTAAQQEPVSSDTSLWHIIESMTAENIQVMPVHDHERKELKQMDTAVLMAAFTTYKNQY